MKPLEPSLREKKRYLVYKVITDDEFTETEVSKTILGECLQFLGELGVSKAGILLVKSLCTKDRGILKVNTPYVDEVKMSLGLINTINGKNAIITVVGVTSTLKKAQTRYLEV